MPLKGITGLGKAGKRYLKELEITSYDQLAEQDAEDLYGRLEPILKGVTLEMVQTWITESADWVELEMEEATEGAPAMDESSTNDDDVDAFLQPLDEGRQKFILGVRVDRAGNLRDVQIHHTQSGTTQMMRSWDLAELDRIIRGQIAVSRLPAADPAQKVSTAATERDGGAAARAASSWAAFQHSRQRQDLESLRSEIEDVKDANVHRDLCRLACVRFTELMGRIGRLSDAAYMLGYLEMTGFLDAPQFGAMVAKARSRIADSTDAAIVEAHASGEGLDQGRALRFTSDVLDGLLAESQTTTK